MNSLTFQEKRIWVSLLTTLVIFGYYFKNVYESFRSSAVDPGEMIGLFISVTVMLIIVEIFSEILLSFGAGRDAKQPKDERDRLIELKATKFAYYLLMAGIWISFAAVFSTSPRITMPNALLFFLVLAEVVKFALQLFFYRRGF
jgi:hypothetical protein